jgi:hypothetical protein
MATKREQEEAFELVRQKYQDEGFGGKLSCTWRRLETIVAVRNNIVVGTVSMAIDNGQGSLPAEYGFPDDDLPEVLAQMRESGHRIVETTCLAAVRNCSVGMGLGRASLQWHMQNSTDIDIVIVAEHHVNMYCKNMLFEPVARPRWCEDHHTTDYALRLDMSDPDAYWHRLAEKNPRAYSFYQDTTGIEFPTYKLAIA